MNAYRFAWYQLRLCFLLVLLLLSTNIASASTETGRPVNSGDEPPDSSYLYGEGAQFHKGLDWNQNFTYGDTVIATAPGVVVDLVETHQDGCHPGGSGLTFCNAYGNYVLIRHNAQHFDAVSSTTNGYVYSLYLHLRQNQVNVNVTNSVVAGTDIADGDDTGNSTGHHLHYQVIVHDLSNRVLSNIDSENRTRNPELWMASLTNTARLVGRVSNNSGDPISSLTVSGTALQKTGWSGGYLQTYSNAALRPDDYLNENFATTDILPGSNRCLTASNGANLGCHNFVAGQTTYIGLYPVYFPDANGSSSGTTSQITIFNTNTTKSARVITNYFSIAGINQGGRRNDLLTTRDPLSFNPPASLNGSALVVASEDNTAIITNSRNSGANRKGATNGILRRQASAFWYIPLVMSNASSVSGIVNSDVHIMNIENRTINVTLLLRGDTSAYNGVNYTANISIPPYASYTYPASTVAVTGWYGTATVNGNGVRVAVTSDLRIGSDTVQSFNAFPIERQSSAWVVPLFTSWLASNSLTTVVGVQNLGSTINSGRLELNCTVSPGTPGSNFTKVSTVSIPTNGAFYFNPVTDGTIPTNWYGSCRVTALDGQNIVSFVQMRIPPPGGGSFNTSNAAAYEAMPANGGKTLLTFPYIQKRPASPANGIATGVTIQNLTGFTANVTYTYYNTNGTVHTTLNCTIAPNSNRLHNHRIQPEDSTCAPNLPYGWIGSLVVTSDRAIDGFNQITDTGNPAGDSFMAHNALP